MYTFMKGELVGAREREARIVTHCCVEPPEKEPLMMLHCWH